jgi:hypothetical protein
MRANSGAEARRPGTLPGLFSLRATSKQRARISATRNIDAEIPYRFLQLREREKLRPRAIIRSAPLMPHHAREREGNGEVYGLAGLRSIHKSGG